MRNHLIAERYARALSETVKNNDDLERAMDAMAAVRAVYESSHDLQSALGNPVIDLDARTKVLDEILDTLDVPAPVTNLLHTLLLRKRIAILPDVATLFENFVDERLNRVTANVTSAAPLSEEHHERVRAGLALYSGKDVRVQHTVDPDIVGGVVAEIEGIIIDGSLRTRLEHLKRSIVQSGLRTP